MNPVAEAFAKLFNKEAQVVASAPGRVNLIGEHIDYIDGYVLPFAIICRTTVAIAKRNDRLIRIASQQRDGTIVEIAVSELMPGTGVDWARYPLGVVWTMGISSGLDVLIDGNVPLGAGLSSSAAIECSMAVALNELFQLGHSPESLAKLTQKAENDYAGMPSGIMDQSVSLMAKAGSAFLLDCKDLSTRNIPFDLGKHELELLIVDTQMRHALTDGGYASRRADSESAVAKLGHTSMRDITLEFLEANKAKITNTEYRRARHAITEIARVLSSVDALENRDFTRLGTLLNQSHASLRDDYNVSCPELDLAVEIAQRDGALGARMVGGGFGGSAIVLASIAKIKPLKVEIADAFKEAGFVAPRFFNSLPSDGASIDYAAGN